MQMNLKSYFGRDFVEITNDDDVATLQKKSMSLYSKMLTWTSKYPSNKVALKWKERMLLRKQDGLKNYRQFIKESENQDEGKLVASQLQIISALMSKLKDRAEKELSKNQEKGVAFLNTLGSFVGAKVTDKKQAKNKLFLKMEYIKEDDVDIQTSRQNKQKKLKDSKQNTKVK